MLINYGDYHPMRETHRFEYYHDFCWRDVTLFSRPVTLTYPLPRFEILDYGL